MSLWLNSFGLNIEICHISVLQWCTSTVSFSFRGDGLFVYCVWSRSLNYTYAFEHHYDCIAANVVAGNMIKFLYVLEHRCKSRRGLAVSVGVRCMHVAYNLGCVVTVSKFVRLCTCTMTSEVKLSFHCIVEWHRDTRTVTGASGWVSHWSGVQDPWWWWRVTARIDGWWFCSQSVTPLTETN